jgi:prepilin-type processing-associated H-X9-DG protein
MEVCFGWASELWWRPKLTAHRHGGRYVNFAFLGFYVTYAKGWSAK